MNATPEILAALDRARMKHNTKTGATTATTQHNTGSGGSSIPFGEGHVELSTDHDASGVSASLPTTKNGKGKGKGREV